MDKINQFIKANYESMSDSEIAQALNKANKTDRWSPNAIEHRRHRMNLKKREKPVNIPEGGFTTELYKFLKAQRKVWTIEHLSNHFDVGMNTITKAMEILKSQGHNIQIVTNTVELSKTIPKADPTRIDARRLDGKVIRFGLTADNHLGSKYARMDVLNALFDLWEREGIKTVYQLGNMVDGEKEFNRFDLMIPAGMDSHVDYFVRNWPQRKGMETHFVTGDDHEGWYVQREGVNIGTYIEDKARKIGRTDLKYLGHMEHDIVFEGTRQNAMMRLIHAGGGSAYATSYSVQKIVESYQGGEKPNILLVGHYHKAEYGYPREVHVIQAGCTQDQTPFMRKQKIQAHVGGWIVEFTLTKEGLISRFKCEWIPFFDRNFEKLWKYHYKT